MSILPNKFSQLLFKPKWQHKDAAIRRSAVQDAQHHALVQELPRIAREDEDQRVRLAALRRVNDFSLYRDRASNDPDQALRSVARTQYLGMLCGEVPVELETHARLRELGIIEANEDIEHIAIHARDVALRRAALERVTRASLIAERAINDPDSRLRQSALERISDASVLLRIAEKTRKTDKLISRLARERVDAQRIASGDNEAIMNRARLLCERLEALLHGTGATRTDDLQQIELAWTLLSKQAPESFRQRYTVAHSLLKKGMERAVNRSTIDVKDTTVGGTETFTEGASSTQREPLVQTEVFTEIDTELLHPHVNSDAAMANARAELQRERDQQQVLLQQLREHVESYTKALEAGDTSTARHLRAAINELRQCIRAVPSATAQTLAQHEAQFAELAHWQHWANDMRRRQLIEAIEALLSAALHPDAVATKVREARTEWKKLDATEDLTEHARVQQGLRRRFQALCHQALKPAHVYFDKRQEVRKSHQEQIEALLIRAEALASENNDWKLIFNLRREATLALRSQLDAVDPRQRTMLAKRLKDVITRLTASLDVHEQAVEQAKATLIAKATALSGASDATSATRDVRELQKRWQAAGIGKRPTDQKQWEQFRAACDVLFDNLNLARKQREVAHTALQTQAQALVSELESLRNSLTQGVSDARTRQREIDKQWHELTNVDRHLQARYQAALEAAQIADEQQQRARRQNRYINANVRYTLIRNLENDKLTAAAAQSAWDGLPLIAREFSAVLSVRFEYALHRSEQGDVEENAAEDIAQRTERARDLLIQIEFLANLESPPEDKQRRMDYQISRLSARLRDGSTESIEVEFSAWLIQWYALGVLPCDQDIDLHIRYTRALQTLLAQIP